VIYFYNVYGERQICKGDMATVVGIFEDHFKLGKKLPVVRPGTQERRFTHVFDTVKACIFAWKKNKSKHYSIASKKSYRIIKLAKMFKSKIRYLPKRKGERFASALTNMNLNNKIIRLNAKTMLSEYIKNFLVNNH
jgi:UDP-glucose 4-epimerase